MKKVVSLFLAVILCMAIAVPAFAASGGPSTTEPRTPEGFTYAYKRDRDMDAEVEFRDGILKIFSYIPGFGDVLFIIDAINFIDSYNKDPHISAQYTEYVYKADDPIGDYSVPYVYWHKLKLTYTTDDGVREVRWSDYYEFAVAPR